METYRLLVDENCPMCCLYEKAFCAHGLLSRENQTSYQSCPPSLSNTVDMDRARNEIALYSVNKNETSYGINALLRLLGSKYSWIERLGKLPVIHQFLLLLYGFISYNRKVIYPVKIKADKKDCRPDLHRGFRWAYIISVALSTGFILNHFTPNLFAYFKIPPNPILEYLICFAQIAWQLAVIQFIKKEVTLEYLGNMSTVSLLGGFALLPYLFVGQFYTISPILCFTYFFAVVCFMLLEHLRRCTILNLPIILTLSWITFRCVVLLLLFIQYS